MRVSERSSRAVLIALALTFVAPSASAEIYKYKKKDGTVTYTDRLSDLPAARRTYYNRLKAERERAQRELERKFGKEELERRKNEKAAKAAAEKKARDERTAARNQAISSQVASYRERAKERDAKRKLWSGRMKAAKARLTKLFKEFREAEKTYNSIATKASFSLFPGEAKKRDTARDKMLELEGQIDTTIHEIQVVIPTAARKAGIPPGWLR